MDQSPNPISPTLIVEDMEKQRRIVWNTHDQSHFGVATQKAISYNNFHFLKSSLDNLLINSLPWSVIKI